MPFATPAHAAGANPVPPAEAGIAAARRPAGSAPRGTTRFGFGSDPQQLPKPVAAGSGKQGGNKVAVHNTRSFSKGGGVGTTKINTAQLSPSAGESPLLSAARTPPRSPHAAYGSGRDGRSKDVIANCQVTLVCKLEAG